MVYTRKRMFGAASSSGARMTWVKQPMRLSKAAYARLNKRTGGFVGAELKFLDWQVGGRVISNVVSASDQDPGTQLALNACKQGTDNQERTGLRAVFKSIEIRGTLQWQDVFNNGNSVRIIVFVDKQTNGTQYLPLSVLKAAGGTEQQTSSWINLSNSHRFQILKDTVISERTTVHYGSTATPSNKVGRETPFRFKIKLGGKNGMITRYLNTGDTVASIADNSVHILMVGNQEGTKVYYTSRMRFYAD